MRNFIVAASSAVRYAVIHDKSAILIIVLLSFTAAGWNLLYPLAREEHVPTSVSNEELDDAIAGAYANIEAAQSEVISETPMTMDAYEQKMVALEQLNAMRDALEAIDVAQEILATKGEPEGGE